jgi:polyhydroxyalkanoate synthase subunit PhaC
MSTPSLQDVINEVSHLHAKWQTAALQLPELNSIKIDESPKTKVWEQDKIKLFHYESITKQNIKIPLLIIYAMVNRPYILDLQADRSLIRNLLAKGHEIYLLDWGYPDHSDQHLMLEDFIEVYMKQAVNWICRHHHLPSIHLLGVCQGGTLSLCFAALHQKQIRSLITMVTPVDFHTTDNLLTHICKHIDVDLLINATGNLSGKWLNALFLSLKPFRLMSEKYVQFIDNVSNLEKRDNFLRMEKWIFDSPDIPAETARKFVKELFQQNKLIKDEFYIGHQKIELRKLKLPIFNIYGLQDHLVPPAASMALADYISSNDYQELAFQGGHIGIYVSQRAQQYLAPAISEWLHRHN